MTESTLDFHTNKGAIEEIALIPTTRLRNLIAGFITPLMKRMQVERVRGISIKLQEERELRDNYVPKVSALELQNMIGIDQDTNDMLNTFDSESLPNVAIQEATDQNRLGGNQRVDPNREQGIYARRAPFQ